MSEVAEKVVVITGASSGLGEATAKMLAEKGAKLVLGARREKRLQQLVNAITSDGGEAIYKTVDVTKRDEVEALANAALEKFGRIDVLVNNAGLMPLAPLDELKVDEWEQMIDVNIKGVMYGVGAVLPTMRKQESGHIINLSSVAGHVVFPGATVYCATKFAVKAISEGIRQESNGQIRSTNISPGAVATELTDHISHKDAKEMADDLYSDAIDSDSIARAITFAIEQPGEVDVNEMVIRPTKQEL
ncbi:SDR family oxidoreductase [Idiomarina sp. UBA4520]|jgi:NADP-dependent 3-hydroxy acid dehydrogenase YdfG|uniref:SDR family oxidoreductase n=1 Tax=Idiomarina sp. UBA4520 TaxID=1946647 RepID=UPI000AE23649|nr:MULTISPECIES: SDR family oxidoreductase [unclassified Idiomarina]MBF39808.1 oxidoreductase [Idiomarinaceae bacterium]|tara:strand:+ start:8457 stop:9194 length:738 start_codon:yes stop_codon:yes gene_type:complete